MDLNRSPQIIIKEKLKSLKDEIKKLKSEMQAKQTKINQMEAQMDEVNIYHTIQLKKLEELTKNMKSDIEKLQDDSQKKDNIIEKFNQELILVKEENNKKMESATKEILNLKKMIEVKNEGGKSAFQEKISFDLRYKSKIDSSKEEIDIPGYESDFSEGNCRSRLSCTRRVHSKVYDFTGFNWRICDFIKIREEAIAKYNTKIYSKPFYSHKNGYKLRLRVNPNGFGDAENTHLSVFFSIINGESDDLLIWPMQRQITIALINQLSGKIFISEKYKLTSIVDKKYGVIFDKPSKRIIKDDDYYYYGTPHFIELNRLINNNENLIKNGSILLKCFID